MRGAGFDEGTGIVSMPFLGERPSGAGIAGIPRHALLAAVAMIAIGIFVIAARG